MATKSCPIINAGGNTAPSAVVPLNNNVIVHSYYRGFITSCKEDLSVKRHLAVTNVSNHWYLFTQWNMIKDLMTF